MLTFSNENLTAKIKKDLGVDTTGQDFLPFPDLKQSVRDDVEKLRNSDLIPDDIVVSAARSTASTRASFARTCRAHSSARGLPFRRLRPSYPGTRMLRTFLLGE